MGFCRRYRDKKPLTVYCKYDNYRTVAEMPMLRNRFFLAIVAVSYGGLVHQSIAGPLTSAEITKIINRVNVIDPAKGGHAAALRDVIKDDLGLQTGTKSRSELLFQDNTL